MKTLKFMLAAATAIGLASATQAAQNTLASTGFEKLSQGTKVVTGLSDNDGYSYFYYAGATADENESEIVSAPDLTDAQRPAGVTRFTGDDLSSRANALKVSTGTDPLLRTFAPLSGSAPQTAAEITETTYVDTLVQFTVTPYSDSVTPTASDKLMIYLKECTNGVGVVSGTNLVVVGGYYDAAAEGDKFIPQEYVTAVSVKPAQWYRLTVEALPNLAAGSPFAAQQKFPAFKVYIDGGLCTFDKRTVANNQASTLAFTGATEMSVLTSSQVVLSLLADGTTPASLQAVGFAGEGVVDDLVVTTTDPSNPNIVDFTFDSTGTGVGAVSFTVNNGEDQTDSKTYEVTIGDTIVVTAAAQEGYVLTAPTTNGLTYVSGDYASCTYTVAGTASLTINAQEQQNTPLKPGEQDPVAYTSQAAAEAAAAKVVIGVPTAVETAFAGDAEKTAAYKAMFETKVVDNGNGTFTVEVGLTAEAEDDLQDQVDDDAAEVIADLSDDEVTLTTTPGLYYSFEYGTTLGTMAEGTRTMATSGTLTLTRPTTENATAGFYKVLVNVTDKE